MKFRLFILAIVVVASVIGALAQTPAELLVNGGFEQSKSLYPWVVETTKGGVLISGPGEHGNPHGGNRYVVLGGTNKEEDAIEQTVIIPQSTADLVLSFALRIKATGNDSTPHDFFKVSFQGEGIDATLVQYSNIDACDWQVISVPNLASYAGKLITLRFGAVTDGTKPTKFCIDDVSLVYTPGSAGGSAPNLEFISPHYGCIYPISTISGATPLRILTDSPDGIQSLTASIDDQIVATTTEPTLEIPINWSNLTPGEHTLTGELIDPTGRIIVKRCLITSSNLLEGADFEGAPKAFWVESSTSDLDLMTKVDPEIAYSGYGVSILGGGTGTTDILEQMVIFPEDTEDTVTLAYLYETPINSSITKTSLQIQLVDAETETVYPVAMVPATSSGWVLARTAFSLSGLGLQKDTPYWLQFKVVSQDSQNQLVPFYIDDVALYVYSATLAAGFPPNLDPSDIPGAEETTPNPNALKPKIISIDRHYGKKEGGDQMVITGSTETGFGFDENDIMVKFRRIKSGTASYGNYIRRQLQSDGTYRPVQYRDPLNSAWINNVTASQIILAPGGPGNDPATCSGQYGCGTPSSYDKKYGRVRIVVKNTASGNGNTSGFGYQGGLGFEYALTQYPPKVWDVSPSSIPIVGGPQYPIDIYGANFVQGSGVKIGEVDCYSSTSFIDSGHLRALLPFWKAKCCSNSCAGNIGQKKVTVTNPDNQSGSKDNAITLAPGPLPRINSFSPSGGSYQGGTEVTIDGQDFSRISSLKVGQDYADCNLIRIDEDSYRTQLKFITPPGCNGKITIYTQDGTSAESETNFHYNDPPRPLTYSGIYPPGGTSSPGWACPLDKNISVNFNGSPACDAIDLSKTTVSIEPTEPGTEKSRLSATITGTTTSDSARKINLHLTSSACPAANTSERHLLKLTVYTLSTFTNTPKVVEAYIWVTPLSLSVTASASPQSGSAPLTVNFTSSASGGTAPYTYSWTFGDGGTSTLQNPSHTYQANGTYNATVTVRDSSSPALESSKVIQISVSSGGSLTVTASASPQSGSAPLAVNFTSSASGGTAPYTYSWTFGDGGTSTLQNPSHTYQANGTYNATVTVRDSSSPALESSKVIPISVSSSGGNLTITASASPVSSSHAPVTVQFTCSASGGVTPYTYSWNFGDGYTSTLQNPSHTYTANGIYTAKITVRDNTGITASKSFSIKVGKLEPDM